MNWNKDLVKNISVSMETLIKEYKTFKSISKDEIFSNYINYIKEIFPIDYKVILTIFCINSKYNYDKGIVKLIKENLDIDLLNYSCVCGYSTNNKQSYCSHCSHCIFKLELNELEIDPDKIDRFKLNPGHRGKGFNYWKDPRYKEKIYPILVERCKLMTSKKTKETYIKQSNTRKMRYLTGELIPAKGVGRGVYSYLCFENKRILLRSTYELIFGLYQLFNGKSFEYESIRSTYEGHVYISDFMIDGVLYEIKGYSSGKCYKIRSAFESIGYKIEFIFPDKIDEMKSSLDKYIDVKDLLKQAYERHKEKNYLEITYLNKSIQY